MFVQVVDNNTNKVLAKVNTNNWATMMVQYIEVFRKEYTNATVEWYYGETPNGTPKTFKTFN